MFITKKPWFVLVVIFVVAVALGVGCQTDSEEVEAEADEELDEYDPEEILEAQGIYEGQIDSQSVEIKLEGQKRAFALEEGLSVADLKSGTEVAIVFYEAADRPVLKEIEPLETAGEIKEGEGIYNGQVDSRSVEIDVDGRPKVFTIDSGLKVDHLVEGSKIAFTYEDGEHRPLMLSVEVLEEAEKEEAVDEEKTKIEGEGVLVGQIDSRSVEIARTRVFELGENVSVDKIEDGSEVAFTFVESEHRPVLESIEKVEQPLEGEMIHGTYIGQVDSSSVEIEFHRAYALGDGVSREGIEDGAEISFTYYDDMHRPELVSLSPR